MQQKQVNLIGLRVHNNNIIQAAELTPDILQKRLVLVTGSIGNGKSSLLNAAKIATSGTDAIKKSDTLPQGFVAEALLIDGEVPIYIGVKTGTYQRGEKAGETKLETYLYTKDANGKSVQPIIDGVAWTAAQYWKALTTELTYSLNDLFSENQSTHRKLIEKLFKPELEALKADEVMARIVEARKERDAARTLCQANGAFMERFEDEGYNENTLSLIYKVDIEKLDRQIRDAEIEKDRMLNAPEAEYRLACTQVDQNRTNQLQKIKDEGVAIKEKIAKFEADSYADYTHLLDTYNETIESRKKITDEYRELRQKVADFIGYYTINEKRNEQGQVFAYAGDERQQVIMKGLDEQFKLKLVMYPALEKPQQKPVPQEMLDAYRAKQEEYLKLQNTPISYPERTAPDTTAIDKRIAELQSEKLSAEKTNSIYTRYQLWRNWIDAKGKYEKEIDTLRKLYASIDTGVEGMKIVPRDTESGRVEVWVMYNGQYDPAYFGNPKQELRFMFDYSSFQRTIIGLMLQAARLNLKPRALRLAFIDDVAFTPKDIDVLADIAEKLDLKLITAWTYEADKENLIEGQVLVEGGEIFF
jgi:hypothetical protein